MGKFYFILSLLFTKICYSQTSTPFDFLEANRAWYKASQFKGLTSDTRLPGSKSCQKLQTSEGESVMECAVEDQDYHTPLVKMDYAAGQIPEQISTILPDSFKKDAGAKNISCLFRFKTTNDNRQQLGCKADNIYNTVIKCGDDVGFTHSLAVGVSCTTEDGVSTAFMYSTDLYTKPQERSEWRDAKGIIHRNQTFTSENIFALLQDNINQGQVSYWKQGVGFINLSEKKKWGLLQSTGQQDWYHDMMNLIEPGQAYKYNYIEGSKDRWAAFVTLSVGLQENRQFGEKCKLRLAADIGARLATRKGSDTLNLNLNGKFSYQVLNKGEIYFRAESETVKRFDSTVTKQTIATGFETKAGSAFEAGLTRQLGNRKDVPDLPNIFSLKHKNDRTVFMMFNGAF